MSDRVRRLFEKQLFLTNAGTETYLVFQQGFELPEFCGFVVFDDEDAWTTLAERQLATILRCTADARAGLLLDALVWRAQPDFLEKLGRDADQLAPINAQAVSKTRDYVARWRRESGIPEADFPVLVSADVGPRGDGYRLHGERPSSDSARAYHAPQLAALAEARVDLVCALTMTSAEEAIGIARAAADVGLPILVSPTVETDGRLPDGRSLGEFVRAVDDATDAAPLFYMVNCAHPTHLRPALDAAREAGESWLPRFRGFRANASRMSHAELDESPELDRGDVDELAREVASMHEAYSLRVVGGCCGTDHEHIAAIAREVAA